MSDNQSPTKTETIVPLLTSKAEKFVAMHVVLVDSKMSDPKIDVSTGMTLWDGYMQYKGKNPDGEIKVECFAAYNPNSKKLFTAVRFPTLKSANQVLFSHFATQTSLVNQISSQLPVSGVIAFADLTQLSISDIGFSIPGAKQTTEGIIGDQKTETIFVLIRSGALDKMINFTKRVVQFALGGSKIESSTKPKELLNHIQVCFAENLPTKLEEFVVKEA